MDGQTDRKMGGGDDNTHLALSVGIITHLWPRCMAHGFTGNCVQKNQGLLTLCQLAATFVRLLITFANSLDILLVLIWIQTV